MQRGEVWWARLPLPTKARPVLLLSRQEIYSRRGYVTAAPVTRTFRPIASHVSLGPAEGLRSASVVNLDSIMTINKRLLERRIGELSAAKMHEVEEAIRFALQLAPYAR
ncbi:MAG: type II toxin-antitoxin system PemK/MazF family toxin [Chloroflexi bacterium]|nr:type II toxin-antitoxin system PemK/MazF family toxin [Chloroflexota bacterium]